MHVQKRLRCQALEFPFYPEMAALGYITSHQSWYHYLTQRQIRVRTKGRLLFKLLDDENPAIQCQMLLA